jgi:lipopolysaccharide/colanic/teichoic acid biosynthesis glycosyltransferase
MVGHASPVHAPAQTFYSRGGKRVLDITVSAALLLLLSPVMLASALAVALTLGWPILYIRERPGRYEAPFRLLKFRTMRFSRTDDEPDAARLTAVGRLMRRASLDELPQLINVLAGDMALVGPRPLLDSYLPFYTPAERIRFAVRPGVTGLAQVSGRNELAWDDRLALDVQYVSRCSLRLDSLILWRTLHNVVRGTGFQTDQASVLPRLDEHRLRQRGA